MTYAEALTWLDSRAIDQIDDDVVEAIQAELTRRGGPCATCRNRWNSVVSRDEDACGVASREAERIRCASLGGGCWAWEGVARAGEKV